VLLAAEGVPGKQIAAMVGCAEPTVVTWRRRYAESGPAGLEDLPRPGKPSPLPKRSFLFDFGVAAVGRGRS
jgi:transposase